jgi:transcriptional regulator with XRE-family HTH domain
MKPVRSPESPDDDRAADAAVARPATGGVARRDGAWRTVMRTIGRRVRHVRDFLGMSQEQVATLAGVSQGAVSRLEAGNALATPLVVVLRIQQALTGHLRLLDPPLLDAEIRRMIALTELLEMPLGNEHVTADAQLDRLVLLFQNVPTAHREPLLAILTAAADGLRSTT